MLYRYFNRHFNWGQFYWPLAIIMQINFSWGTKRCLDRKVASEQNKEVTSRHMIPFLCMVDKALFSSLDSIPKFRTKVIQIK